jgi:hypothetical protein
MAFEPQLFIGRLSSFSPKYNNIVAIKGDTINGQNTITNVIPFNATYDLSLLRIGQIINPGTAFSGDVTITNIVGNTITVGTSAISSQTQATLTIDTPSGTYFFNSASLFDPKNIVKVTNITGSNDANYNPDLTPVYAIIGPASSTIAGIAIPGTFHLYKITDVTYRNLAVAQISGFVSWGEEGVQSDSGQFLLSQTSQTIAIGAMSTTSSQVTIYDNSILTSTPAGSSVAGYQIALPNLLDHVITSSAGAGFPFTGSADITGSLQVTGSVIIEQPVGNVDAFLIKSGSGASAPPLFKIDATGTLQFFAHANNYAPTAVLGGLYFTSQSVYVGVE